MREYKNANMQVCKYAMTHVFTYARMQTFKWARLPVCKGANIRKAPPVSSQELVCVGVGAEDECMEAGLKRRILSRKSGRKLSLQGSTGGCKDCGWMSSSREGLERKRSAS